MKEQTEQNTGKQDTHTLPLTAAAELVGVLTDALTTCSKRLADMVEANDAQKALTPLQARSLIMASARALQAAHVLEEAFPANRGVHEGEWQPPVDATAEGRVKK